MTMIPENEIQILERAMAMALEAGAQKARFTLSWSCMDSFATLNGELDRVNHCLDHALTICLFVDGRFGSFSTNLLQLETLGPFLQKAVSTVRMLAEDPCRDLPDPARTARDARTGRELGLLDPAYASINAARRLDLAGKAAIFPEMGNKELRSDTGMTYRLISEEGEYSDTLTDQLVIDSNGLRCRHTETAFEYGVETTIQDSEGRKYSGYWWDSSPLLERLDLRFLGRTAMERAAAQIAPENPESGKYNLVVDSECASRLVNPLLKALGGYSLQQRNSFLEGTLGTQVFSEGLTLVDRPRTPGRSGSKLFDSEGVATKEAPIIEGGIVRTYFINTYIARKMNTTATVEEALRPVLLPYLSPVLGERPSALDRKAILEKVKNGILVTGFNGGNNNSSTGDFSYGIEGFLFEEGRITRPVREMLITGNFLTLWNHLLAAGDDARFCMSKLIPTLAFENVDFSS